MKPILLYLFLGWTIAPFVHFFNTYIFSDWDYLIFLTVLSSCDTVMGVTRALVKHEFSTKAFGKVFIKIIIYSCALIVSHVLVYFTVKGKTQAVFSWFDTVVLSAIVVREAISIFESIAVIEPGVFPIRILKYLKSFDSVTGNKL